MTEKEMKRLSRADLLELLLVQTRENERLQAELEAAQAQLADRSIRMEEAGNIANAALALNGVMEAAQAAADSYLENIKRMQAETELMYEEAKETKRKADLLMRKAKQDMERVSITANLKR